MFSSSMRMTILRPPDRTLLRAAPRRIDPFCGKSKKRGKNTTGACRIGCGVRMATARAYQIKFMLEADGSGVKDNRVPLTSCDDLGKHKRRRSRKATDHHG